MNFLTIKKNKKSVQQQGFTLVEIMVSISIFTVIMATGIGALVTITRSYQVSRTQAVVTNNIHFAMDSMVRDIRIGNAYYAADFTSSDDFSNSYNQLDGTSYVLNFMGIPERGHLRYTFDINGAPYLTRYQAVDAEESKYPMLTGDGIQIDNALFRVVGSDPDDAIQPSVFIYLRGTNTISGADFVLQTFVSQRSLDI